MVVVDARMNTTKARGFNNKCAIFMIQDRWFDHQSKYNARNGPGGKIEYREVILIRDAVRRF